MYENMNERAFKTVGQARKNPRCRAIAWDSSNPGPILGFDSEQSARDFCHCQKDGDWEYECRPFTE